MESCESWARIESAVRSFPQFDESRTVSRHQAEVIIVGAGTAGLSAGRFMSQAGIRTTILEARDRLGGRIRTLHVPMSPLPVELGAEFVHGQPAETLAIVRAAGLNLDHLPDDHYPLVSGEKLVRAGNLLSMKSLQQLESGTI